MQKISEQQSAKKQHSKNKNKEKDKDKNKDKQKEFFSCVWWVCRDPSNGLF
jgi:hypothetical protein